MDKESLLKEGVPIAPDLSEVSKSNKGGRAGTGKKRIVYISFLAVLIAAATSLIARLLVYLINITSNLSFYGQLDASYHTPSGNSLGLWVILIPAVGGLIVGLIALYGSKAIRGHGIPEAMEQILTNESRIKPSITYLKPLATAISIGTGGPFGAEGPIIATGGALGSTIGQVLHISANERKVLLTAGAVAGMSTIFGSPIAAIFLAIELLLFEFSPRAIIPVALACITGAAGRHILFDSGPVFPMPAVAIPGNSALALYSLIGLCTGILAAGTTKVLYWIEDAFEKLPVHWMWWPVIGGIFVGLIGYFAPGTLGVGYENITGLLSGTMALRIIVSLCFLKFLSWAIALGSGTAGGTMAPLLTIGAAAGSLMCYGLLHFFPSAGRGNASGRRGRHGRHVFRRLAGVSYLHYFFAGNHDADQCPPSVAGRMHSILFYLLSADAEHDHD